MVIPVRLVRAPASVRSAAGPASVTVHTATEPEWSLVKTAMAKVPLFVTAVAPAYAKPVAVPASSQRTKSIL